MPRRTWFAGVLAAGLFAAPPTAALADEPAPPAPPAPAPEAPPVRDAGDGAAQIAIAHFEVEYRSESSKARVEAVLKLGKTLHPTVAALLLDFATSGAPAVERGAAFTGLALQKSSTKTIGPRVAKYLAEAAEENRKAKARGNFGVRVDPKTGKPDTESAEGKLALKAKRERGAMLAEAVRVLDVHDRRDKDSVEVLSEFLLDGNDDLVAVVLGMFGKWKEWSVLTDFLGLYEMYPTEDVVNVGSASVDTGADGSADAQAAKRAWSAKYGDPDRRRARPVLVRALRKAIEDITGEKFDTPEAFREFLHRPEVKRKVKAK